MAHLFVRYQSYQDFSEKKFHHTIVQVLNHYQKVKKSGKVYHVLKLKSDDGYTFYTTNYEDLIDLNGRKLRLGLITDKINFLDFLSTFYVPSYDIRIDEKHESFKDDLATLIASQHENHIAKELFGALFLAKPISKDLRQDVSKWGISHLIAISGFHLGILSGILFFLLRYPYIYLQNRYFPYRNMYFDLMIVILVVLFSYLYMLNFIPSLLRSFVMLFYGFFLFHRHFKIISFEVLLVTVFTVLVLFPSFLFSIGFWFSVSGVFYIYLFLHHFGDLAKWKIVILLNIWVYMMMIPVVHYFFDIFSVYQLFSPFLSILFGLFYPLEMFLHMIGQGDLFDEWIVRFLHIRTEIYHFQTPLWYLIGFIMLSLTAIFDKRLMFILALSSMGVYFIG